MDIKKLKLVSTVTILSATVTLNGCILFKSEIQIQAEKEETRREAEDEKTRLIAEAEAKRTRLKAARDKAEDERDKAWDADMNTPEYKEAQAKLEKTFKDYGGIGSAEYKKDRAELDKAKPKYNKALAKYHKADDEYNEADSEYRKLMRWL